MTYQREDSVENYLVRRCRELGGKALKFVSPGWRGVPDRLCIFGWAPEARGPVSFFVELKAPGGRLEPWQERCHKKLRYYGQRVYVCWTREQVNEVLKVEGLE